MIATDPAERGPLCIANSRWHSGRLLVKFAGVDDRTAAEALRGTNLVVDVDEAARPADPDEFFDHHLVGLWSRRTAARSERSPTCCIFRLRMSSP